MKSKIQYFNRAALLTQHAHAAMYEQTDFSGTPYGRLGKSLRNIGGLLAMIVALCLCNLETKAQGTPASPLDIASVPVNASNEYVIPASGYSAYYFTGTSGANRRIRVERGYHGAIHLKGVSITTAGVEEPPIRIEGVNGNSWADYPDAGPINDNVVAKPLTVVDIILEGNNFLQNTAVTCAVLQVDLGAQINIKSHLEEPLPARPTDAVNAAGQLEVRKTASPTVTYDPVTRTFTGDPTGGSTGAAIGGPTKHQGRTVTYNKATPDIPGATNFSTGGSVIITSGTIVAVGGAHAAGIGGPHRNDGTYYNGIIMIYGGIVSAISGGHGAGIGSGCPTGGGVVPTVGGASMIIAIPPASVRAYTRQGDPPNFYGLAGARDIVYIGDPQSPTHFTVYTEDFMETTMELDLSKNPRIRRTIDSLAPQFNPARLYLGETNVYGPSSVALVTGYPYGGLNRLDGNILWTYSSLGAPYNTYNFENKYVLQNAAMFNTPVTFFTRQKNDRGYEYIPEARTFSAGNTFTQTMVELKAPIFKPTLECIPASVLPPDTSALIFGYDSLQASTKASTLRIGNSGNRPLFDFTFKLVAEAFTDVHGGPLEDDIQAALDNVFRDTVINGVSKKYFPPQTFVEVKTMLKMGLDPGEYEGQMKFSASDVPPIALLPISFTASVVRFELNPPVLTTDPAGMSVTNGSPFRVIATFDEPVRWIRESDFNFYKGRVQPGSLDSTVSTPVYYTGDTRPYYTRWAFWVDTVGSGISEGDVMQITALDRIAYELHGVSTTEVSNTLNLTLNSQSPFATFHFDYDLPLDSIFLLEQDTFTFTLTANGSAPAADSVHHGADYATGINVQQEPYATLKAFIEIRKGGSAIPAGDWDITSVNGNNTFRIEHHTPGGFDEGDYEAVLAPGAIHNNVEKTMGETVGRFKVCIAELSGCHPEPNAGLGIKALPVDSLEFPGGEAELVLTGRNLQHAAKAHALKIKLPYALGDIAVEPDRVSAAGDSAVYTVHIPANNTDTEINYDFVALTGYSDTDTARVDAGACPKTKPVASVTVRSAPPVKITNPVCMNDPSDCAAVTVQNPWMQGCEKKYEVFIPYTGFDREVKITYLGLADKYLYQYGGGHPTSIVVPADETYLELFFMTARVPDGQEGGTGAIVLSTPSLPSDTSLFFTFWNEPDLSEMVYIPRTTMYGGLLELNIRGGSPDLLRSFNEGATWESAWAPISGLDLERLDHEIRFYEPGGCRLYTVDMPEPSQGGLLEREVELPAYAFAVTDPLNGLHQVESGKDFRFTVTLTGPYAEFTPEVSTTRRLSPDEVFITKQEDGSFRVRIPAIRENIRIIIRVNGEELPDVGNEYVEVTRVWTSDGEVYIHSTAPGEAQIYTLTGALVRSVPVTAGQAARTALPPGFHFVKLNGKTYKVGVQ